jgi:putative transposase
MLADTIGRPLRFRITPGQASDIRSAADLLDGQRAESVLADKAYDSNGLRDTIKAMKAEAVIPSKRNRKVFIPHNIDVYKHRNRIERCFNRLKHFRRFATRYDRHTIHFEGFGRFRAGSDHRRSILGNVLKEFSDAANVEDASVMIEQQWPATTASHSRRRS